MMGGFLWYSQIIQRQPAAVKVLRSKTVTTVRPYYWPGPVVHVYYSLSNKKAGD